LYWLQISGSAESERRGKVKRFDIHNVERNIKTIQALHNAGFNLQQMSFILGVSPERIKRMMKLKIDEKT
jgi:hypothetical protein